MAGLTKIEEYLIDLGISYEEIAPSTWLIEDAGKGLPRMRYPIRAYQTDQSSQKHSSSFCSAVRGIEEQRNTPFYPLTGGHIISVE